MANRYARPEEIPEPGLDRDVLLADLLGWTELGDHYNAARGSYRGGFPPGPRERWAFATPIPSYSVYMTELERVVNTLRMNGWMLRVAADETGFGAVFGRSVAETRDLEPSRGATMADAISAAAIECLRREKTDAREP